MSYFIESRPLPGPLLIDYSAPLSSDILVLPSFLYPSEQSRSEIETRSRLNLTLLSQMKNLTHELLPGAHQHNRRISNGSLTVYLDHEVGPGFPEGHVNPGFWSVQIMASLGSVPAFVGHSMIDLLAQVRGMDAATAERVLVRRLNIPSDAALRDWQPKKWGWDSDPLIDVRPHSWQLSQQHIYKTYWNAVGTVSLLAIQSLTTSGPQIRYLSRWRRASSDTSHWVEALPPGKLPLFGAPSSLTVSDRPITILPSEFDLRFGDIYADEIFCAVPGGTGNLDRTDLRVLEGRALHLELLPHELRFTVEIEAALNRSRARDVIIGIVGEPKAPFPLSHLREVAAHRGVEIPPLALPAPRLSSTALLSAGAPLPPAGLKRPAILDPVLHEGGLGWLYAAEKLGKTWLALTLAHTVATGGSFGPWQAPERRKVLFIDGEMHPDDLDTAMAAVSRGHGDGETLPFSALCAKRTPSGQINLLDPDWRKEIIGMAADFDLLILDNFYSLTNNVAGEFQEVLEFLQELRSNGTAILVIDHTNREGVLQGTHTKERAAETVIELRVPEGKNWRDGLRAIEVTKARHYIPQPADHFFGEMVFTEGSFHFEVSYPEAPTMPEPVPDQIAKLAPIVIARDIDKLSFPQIYERLGTPRSTASDWYKKAKDLTGTDREALEQEISRLLDERKATE